MIIRSHPSAKEVFADCYAERVNEMSRADLMAKVESWEHAVLEENNEIFGAVVRKNGEFHFGILPLFRGKWATRTRMKQILDWAGESGEVRTSALAGSMGEKLARFVGMKVSDVTQKGSHYVYP